MDQSVGIDNQDERRPERWRHRLPASVAVGALAFSVPVVSGLAWVLIVEATASADDRLASQIRWWSMVGVGLVVVVLLTARLSRRLIPVSALLRLDLEFPDIAPDRLRMGILARSARSIDAAPFENDGDDDDALANAHDQAIHLLQLTVADRTARRHAERVRRFASLIGGELFLAPGDRLRLEWMALLHDVDSFGETVEPLRRWLGDWSDTRGARIVELAEAYDIMTSIELNRNPQSPALARAEILERAGTTFAPEVVQAFLAAPSAEMDRPIGPWGGIDVLGSVVRRLSLPRIATASAIALSTLFGTALAAPDQPTSLAFQDEPGPEPERSGLDETHTTELLATTHPLERTAPTVSTVPPPNVPHRPPFDYWQVLDRPGEAHEKPSPPSRPEAVNDTASTAEDTSVSVDVLANDGPAGLELDPASLRVVSTSTGEVAIDGGQITYSPPPDASGTARIVYEICSTEGVCDTASLVITVLAVEDVLPFVAEGELQIPSDAGPQVIPWLVVSAGKPPLAEGTVISTVTDHKELFVAIPRVNNVGTLTFEPRVNSKGSARTTIRVAEPGKPRRTFVLRLIVG